MSNTDLPIVADGENGGGSPVTTYRTVQKLERATQEKMSSVMGGMQLPPGMKMPF